jgi:hypothetical protein
MPVADAAWARADTAFWPARPSPRATTLGQPHQGPASGLLPCKVHAAAGKSALPHTRLHL